MTYIYFEVNVGSYWFTIPNQGSHYRSPLSPNAKKKYFWHKNTSFGENKWRKKILLPKHRHHLGCFMSLNRQLASWITCLKSVADQLIHDDDNSPYCLQLLKHVKLFFFLFFWHNQLQLTLVNLWSITAILGTLTFCEGPWDNLTLLQWYNLTQHRLKPLHGLFV